MKRPDMIAACRALFAAVVIGALLGGCRYISVQDFGEELVRDNEGKIVMLPDGKAQTFRKGWRAVQNSHWIDTKFDAMKASIVKDGSISFSMNGLNSAVSPEFAHFMDVTLTGCANLAAKVGAAIATAGGSAGAEAVAGMVKKFVQAGGDASKASVSCSGGSCTITDGTVTCTDGSCYRTGEN